MGRKRVAGGGAPVKVRVVKGANLPMELVDAAVHGWPAATWHTKCDSDTSYKAVLDYALTSERVANVRVGAAGHNLFDIALAWLLAKARGATAGLDVEMLLGMATAQAEAVKRDVGSLLLYTPVVHPDEFDVAISYLVRRLEEGAGHDNFMSAVFSLSDDPAMFDREKQRFLDSLGKLESITGDGDPASYRVPEPHRQQNRAQYDDAGAEARIEARWPPMPNGASTTPRHRPRPARKPQLGPRHRRAHGVLDAGHRPRGGRADRGRRSARRRDRDGYRRGRRMAGAHRAGARASCTGRASCSKPDAANYSR